MKIKIVDRLNPAVTFTVIALIIIFTLVMGWYGVTGALVISLIFGLLEGVQFNSKDKPYQRYGQE